MSDHSNPVIQEHINNSEELVQKMQHLTQIIVAPLLSDRELAQKFLNNLGIEKE